MIRILIFIILIITLLSCAHTPKLEYGYVYEKSHQESKTVHNESLGITEVIPGHYIIRYQNLDDKDSVLTDFIYVNKSTYESIEMGEKIFINQVSE
jgi:hypothetical protein